MDPRSPGRPAARPGRPTLDVGALDRLVVARAPRPRPSLGYRIALGLAAALVVLLPLCYLSLLGGIGYGVWWFVEHRAELVPASSVDRPLQLAVARWWLPITGLVVLLALVKPIVARRRREEEPLALDPEREPLLFAYVGRIAELVGAPKPTRIQVALDANASASFRRGLRSLAGDDLVLTLGLSLVSALDLRGLTSVIAHELGHFTQGAGMRSTYVTRCVQQWFYRVVFERDRFDAALDTAGRKSGHVALLLLFNMVRACVWCSRRVLHGLMYVAEVVVSALSRQMEFDADAHAYRIAGSRAFSTSMVAIQLADYGHAMALQQVNAALDDERLGDDWVELVRANVRALTDGQRKELLAQRGGGVRMFASHPPPDVRMARAEAAAVECGVAVEAPGSALFADFRALVRDRTEALYRGSLGDDYDPAMLVPSARLHEEVRRAAEATRAAGEGLGEAWHAFTLLRLPPAAPLGRPATAEDVREARARDVEGLAERERVLAELDRRDGEVRLARIGHLFLDAKVRIKRKQFGLTRKSVALTREEHLAEAEAVFSALEPHAQRLAHRLDVALAALDEGGVASHVEDAAGIASRARTGAAVLRDLAPACAALHAVSRARTTLEFAAEVLFDAGKKGQPVLRRWVEDVAWFVDLARTALGDAPYPFDHGGEHTTLAGVLLRPIEPDTGAPEAHDAAGQATRRSWQVASRALGCVMEAILAVERAVGEGTSAAAA